MDNCSVNAVTVSSGIFWKGCGRLSCSFVFYCVHIPTISTESSQASVLCSYASKLIIDI